MALSPLLRHDTQAMCGEFWSLFSHTKGKKSRPIQKAFCVGFVTWLSKGLEAAFLLQHDTGFSSQKKQFDVVTCFYNNIELFFSTDSFIAKIAKIIHFFVILMKRVESVG